MGRNDLKEGTRTHNRTTLSSRSDSPTRARSVCRSFLSSLDPPMEDEAASAVELVVSELVTNTVRHARGTVCTLDLEVTPEAVAVLVHDDDPTPPQERTPDLTGGTGGFGWPMVVTLASDVTVKTTAHGKTICALLSR
ncbi:ATP-binding protein [Streptomyces bicolor]|uniref:ATP-binding protein n=1 Tax=Streptomyces bicolor TaxID=66874 RepID=UPI0004E0E7C9|nr:ATP-binding protein [Streptomyces bicolor]